MAPHPRPGVASIHNKYGKAQFECTGSSHAVGGACRVLSAQQALQVLQLPIQAQYAPNVYVSVLGITPRGEFQVLPGRYDTEAPGFFWGNLNLPVRLEVEPLVVKISPGKKDLRAEPGAKVELDFLAQTPDGKGVEAELAVAVVDEAVLALTGFKTPTLDQLVRFDQPLAVYTGELRALLVHQTPFYLARSESLTGGGGMSGSALSQLRKRFEPVAYFNPAVRTDAEGKAKVSFTLPDNMTTYRVYVVAQDRGSRFASPERPLLATKDFYLEPGLPGFFTQGDRFQFQVAAFNQRSGYRSGEIQRHCRRGALPPGPGAHGQPAGQRQRQATGGRGGKRSRIGHRQVYRRVPAKNRRGGAAGENQLRFPAGDDSDRGVFLRENQLQSPLARLFDREPAAKG